MKRSTLLSAAVLSIGSIAYVGCDRNDTTTSNTGTSADRPTAGERVDNAMENAGDATGRAVDKTVDATKDAGDKLANATDRAGDKLRDATNNASDDARTASGRVGEGTAAAPDAEGIRDVLAQVAEASLTKGGLDDLVERLVDADRNRIGQTLQKDNADLDGRIDQFRKDWQAKYGQDFDITNEEQAFPNSAFAITQGEIGRNAAGAEVNVDVDRNAAGGRTATVDVDRKSGVDRPDSTAADANRNDPGRNVASVRIQASHGLPALTVPMIHEAPDSWRIDVPNTLTAEKLKANVLAHLTAANQMKDQWPADVNQAHAMVTHHVLMALMDKPAQQQ